MFVEKEQRFRAFGDINFNDKKLEIRQEMTGAKDSKKGASPRRARSSTE